jgi:hypothetical protein
LTLDTRCIAFKNQALYTPDIRENIVAISSARKDNLMERRHLTDKRQEGTAKPTGKSGKSNFSRKLLLEKYTWHESIDDQRELHGDPRLVLALQNLSLHQDSDVIPSDGDYGYGYPVFGRGFTPHLDASASSASDQGTLAGGGGEGSSSQEETAEQKRDKAIVDAEAVANYKHGNNHFAYKKHQNDDLWNRSHDSIEEEYSNKVIKAENEYKSSKGK